MHMHTISQRIGMMTATAGNKTKIGNESTMYFTCVAPTSAIKTLAERLQFALIGEGVIPTDALRNLPLLHLPSMHGKQTKSKHKQKLTDGLTPNQILGRQKSSGKTAGPPALIG
jgi:hypothetical protein